MDSDRVHLRDGEQVSRLSPSYQFEHFQPSRTILSDTVTMEANSEGQESPMKWNEIMPEVAQWRPPVNKDPSSKGDLSITRRHSVQELPGMAGSRCIRPPVGMASLKAEDRWRKISASLGVEL